MTERVDNIALQHQVSSELLDRLVDRVVRMVSAIGSHQEALRLISQQHNEWREQMRIIQTEIRDIWQYLNNQLRNRGNDGGQNWSNCWSSAGVGKLRALGFLTCLL